MSKMKAKLELVKTPKATPVKYDETKGLKRMVFLRRQLFIAAVRYIKEGKTGTMMDRLRLCSDMTGIPRLLLEAEVKKN